VISGDQEAAEIEPIAGNNGLILKEILIPRQNWI
jgi:hypothetical protein